MAKWIFNDSGTEKTYLGQTIADQAYYQIQPAEEVAWANDDTLLSDIGSAAAVVSTTNSSGGHLGVSAGINHLKDIDANPTDADNARLFRPKMAPTGWTFQARGIEWETSQLSSIVNTKHDGTGWGDCTLKLYDSSDVEITTQGTADTDCVKTVLDWEPTYDYEVVGGFINMLTDLTQDVRCYIIGVPDLTEAQGGSKQMVSGINFNFLAVDSRLSVDGRTSKRLNYDGTYHTNKLRVIMTHPAGHKTKFMVVFEHYKA